MVRAAAGFAATCCAKAATQESEAAKPSGRRKQAAASTGRRRFPSPANHNFLPCAADAPAANVDSTGFTTGSAEDSSRAAQHCAVEPNGKTPQAETHTQKVAAAADKGNSSGTGNRRAHHPGRATPGRRVEPRAKRDFNSSPKTACNGDRCGPCWAAHSSRPSGAGARTRAEPQRKRRRRKEYHRAFGHACAADASGASTRWQSLGAGSDFAGRKSARRARRKSERSKWLKGRRRRWRGKSGRDGQRNTAGRRSWARRNQHHWRRSQQGGFVQRVRRLGNSGLAAEPAHPRYPALRPLRVAHGTGDAVYTGSQQDKTIARVRHIKAGRAA